MSLRLPTLHLLLAMLALAESLILHHSPRCGELVHLRTSMPMLAAKKKASAGKKNARGVKTAPRGFGAAKAPENVREMTPEQRQWLDFMEWVTSSGGKVDAVRMASCGGGLRGLKATRDLAKGEGIVRIPRSIVLDVARAEASPVSGVWRRGGAPDDLPRYTKIALALLCEQRRGAASKLGPYLELLPSTAEFVQDGGPAAMWSDDELALTECGKLIDAARRRRAQNYGDGHPALQPAALAASWEQLKLPGDAPSAEELAWAVCAWQAPTHE
jgi:hypothetical protein